MNSVFQKWHFLAGTLLVSGIVATSISILPGCGLLGTIGLAPHLVAAGVAGSQNYQVDGSAKSAVDPVNPEFGGVTSVGTAGATSLNISWKAATDVGPPGTITYRIYYSTATDEATIVSQGTQVTTTETTLALSNTAATAVSAGTTYHFVVRAFDEAGNTDGNAQKVSARTNLKFGGITGLESRTSSILRASWTAGEGAPATNITYTAHVSSASSTVSDLLASTTVATSAAGATSVDITGLTAGTLYNVLIRATSSDGNTEGNTANTTVSSVRARLSFAGITSASTQSATSLRASWSAASGAASGVSYTAYASTSSDVATILATTNVATSAADATRVDITGLTSNTVYNILVRATTSNNDEGTVSPNTATSSARTRLSFAGITSLVTTTTPTELTVGWAAPTVVASGQTISYTVHHSDTLTSASDIVASGTAATAVNNVITSTITGLTRDTLYRMVVRAAATSPTNSEDGNTALQSERTPLTFAGATGLTTIATTTPPTESRNTRSSSQLDVSWAAAAGLATGNSVTYRVYRSTTNTSAAILAGTMVTSTETTTRLTGLTAGTYRIIVRAISSGTEATEDLNTVTRTGTTAASVSGTVTQTPPTVGNLLFFLADGTGNAEGAFLARLTVTGTNTYTIPNISPDTLGVTRYVVRVGRDTNINGNIDMEEPTALSSFFTLAEGDAATVNIPIP